LLFAGVLGLDGLGFQDGGVAGFADASPFFGLEKAGDLFAAVGDGDEFRGETAERRRPSFFHIPFRNHQPPHSNIKRQQQNGQQG
jgi:hypothetical protein